MGGQTILLHAVFLTNHYMTKQYIMYKSKAACQTVITIALVARPNRAERKYVLSKNLYNHRLCLRSSYNGNMFTLPKLQQFPGKLIQ